PPRSPARNSLRSRRDIVRALHDRALRVSRRTTQSTHEDLVFSATSALSPRNTLRTRREIVRDLHGRAATLRISPRTRRARKEDLVFSDLRALPREILCALSARSSVTSTVARPRWRSRPEHAEHA